MKSLGRRMTIAAAIAVALGGIGIQPAAADGWARTLSCGSNYTCSITTNTSAGVTHYVNGAFNKSWSTSGSHTSTKHPVGGTVTASAGTSGIFYSHTASCYCPPGQICGSSPQ